MQVKPVMGMETRPTAPAPQPASRDVNRKTFNSEMADGTKHCRHALQTPDHRCTGSRRVRGRVERDGRPGREDRQRRTDDGRYLAPRQGQRERCAPRGRGNQCEGPDDRRQEDHAAIRRAG
ncbi:hypothetical protein BCEN4_620012 [Burkholderia cenocepacia]|nr:hypothetical protein BCEN4_620012 [Burkholderia cenocepacia]